MNQPLTTALRLARHLLNDLERVNLGFELLPHLRPGENVDTGALRVLADRVEWLERLTKEYQKQMDDIAGGVVDSWLLRDRDRLAAKVAELERQCSELEDKVREGDRFVLEEHVMSWTRLRQHLEDDDRGESLVERIEGVMLERGLLRRQLAEAREMRTSLRETAASTIDKLQGEILVLEDKCSSLMMEVDRLRECADRRYKRSEEFQAELAEARAENGRQAATIAAMLQREPVLGFIRGKFNIAPPAKCPPPATIETPHTGRDDKALFRDWMEFPAVYPKPLHLEVGKTYVRRDGGWEEIVLDRGDTFEYRFQSASNATFRRDGTFGELGAHTADLVALAPTIGPASPHP